MTTPLISVIVPVYRVEEYLERCVKSILFQTYKNLEVILVDDGSPDQCPAICDACAEKDARVKVIHQENKGLSGARNAGIDAAFGEYLAFVDSDDYVSPHFIEELYQLLKDTGCAIGQCRFSYVKGEGLVEEGDSAFCIYRGESLMEQLYGPEEKATCFVVAWNKLYRAELFKETGIRYPEGRIHEDEATTYRLFHEAKKLAFLDRALYGYYTENGGSITSVFSAKRLQWLTAHEERIAFFKKNGYEKLLPAAYRKLCDACITFYFRCTEQVKDAEELKKELRKRLETYRANGAAWIAALPLKTRMGYELFSMSPGLYAKMLQKMQETL
ncbi:glycosyltransferase family 2 protein [Hominiventricola filiformis]|uniref:Glycosyltransferase n=1 Tax=Hominiventricola filiformis TaxID=2885352 RepID=A0AAE3A594_9FIRM|nr:glycosyltransferase family 2 protein [Hominiventricola filiformis]MCC2126272.1 glycosyltransferase [Hominiventricola filiformis]